MRQHRLGRLQLGEANRTDLGHLRHEIATTTSPSWWSMVGWVETFQRPFGDETLDYQAALAGHYGANVPDGGDWSTSHEPYSTMHPWEDWAETFAHYLHICDGLETATAFGLAIGEPARSVADTAWAPPDRSPVEELSIGPMIGPGCR